MTSQLYGGLTCGSNVSTRGYLDKTPISAMLQIRERNQRVGPPVRVLGFKFYAVVWEDALVVIKGFY